MELSGKMPQAYSPLLRKQKHHTNKTHTTLRIAVYSSYTDAFIAYFLCIFCSEVYFVNIHIVLFD